MYVFWAIMLSLLVHMLLWSGMMVVPASWLPERTDPTLTEVVIIQSPKSKNAKETQVVRDVETPDKVREEDSKEPARFLSAQQRRVILESRSRETGLTRNGQALPKNSWMREEKQEQAQREKNQNKDMDGYEPIPLPKPSTNTGRFFDDAPSTTGETLPDDVSIGNFTALNTDRFKYYSFYSRMEELIRFRWERELHDAVDAMDQNYLVNVVGKRNWVTKVEFWLTSDGHFHSAHIHQESGIKRFDLSAVKAFRDANFFPNPPKDMIEEDGMIRIQYSFNVHWSPSAMVGR